MTVIWGLDLKEMQWWKFKSSYMWNNEYYRRRTKFIIYQCAMIFCVVSESLGTAALSDYIDEQDFVEHLNVGASIYNDDFIGIFSYNIFVGVYVATIFGSAFFFDLFWPERHESPGVKMAWRITSILAIMFTLSSALGCTIILATHKAHVTGANEQEARAILDRAHPKEPLVYKHNPRGIASVVFLWLGFVSTIASTVLLWRSIAHIDTYGPFSSHVRDKGISSDSTQMDTEMPGVQQARGSHDPATLDPAATPQQPPVASLRGPSNRNSLGSRSGQISRNGGPPPAPATTSPTAVQAANVAMIMEERKAGPPTLDPVVGGVRT